MDIKMIERKIKKAIRDEEQTGRTAARIREVTQAMGIPLTDQQIQETVAFIAQYVQYVPHLLQQGIAAAGQLGIGGQMGQMMAQLEAYWREENDLIPDDLGLMGITDDAYATLFLLQSLSDTCKMTLGRAILAEDVTAANNVIARVVLGEPIAGTLQQRVAVTLAEGLWNQLAQQFVSTPFTMGQVADPYWGGVSLNEYVDVQLGAMGVV